VEKDKDGLDLQGQYLKISH